MVWARDLYIEKAQRQLSDARCYQRLNHDCADENQRVVKSAVQNLISSCKLPPAANNLIVSNPRIGM